MLHHSVAIASDQLLHHLNLEMVWKVTMRQAHVNAVRGTKYWNWPRLVKHALDVLVPVCFVSLKLTCFPLPVSVNTASIVLLANVKTELHNCRNRCHTGGQASLLLANHKVKKPQNVKYPYLILACYTEPYSIP